MIDPSQLPLEAFSPSACGGEGSNEQARAWRACCIMHMRLHQCLLQALHAVPAVVASAQHGFGEEASAFLQQVPVVLQQL